VPILTLAAVTGMRRGELVTVRRSQLFPSENRIRIATASDGIGVKTTKTRKERNVSIDADSMAMLLRHCEISRAASSTRMKSCSLWHEAASVVMPFARLPDTSR
jgi:integrase